MMATYLMVLSIILFILGGLFIRQHIKEITPPVIILSVIIFITALGSGIMGYTHKNDTIKERDVVVESIDQNADKNTVYILTTQDSTSKQKNIVKKYKSLMPQTMTIKEEDYKISSLKQYYTSNPTILFSNEKGELYKFKEQNTLNDYLYAFYPYKTPGQKKITASIITTESE